MTSLRILARVVLVSGVPRSLAVLVLAFAVCVSARATDRAMTVTGMDPIPNYPLTADPADAVQLADGKVLRFPAWTKRGSVGWKDSSFVRVSLSVGILPESSCLEAKLSLVIGQKPSAGVFLPRRIDFYSGASESKLEHAGSIEVDDSAPDRAGAIKLVSKISVTGSAIVLGLHAGGRYLMVDEIEIEPIQKCEFKTLARKTLTIAEIRADSTQHLMEQLAKASGAFSRQGTEAVLLEAIAPFVAEPVSAPSLTSDTEGAIVALPVVPFGDTDLLVRIVGACPNGSYDVSVTWNDDESEGIELYQLASVVSFTGNRQYDPLVPMSDGKLPCRSDHPAEFVWIKVRVDSGKRIDEPLHVFVLDDAGERASLSFRLYGEVDEATHQECIPKTVTWGYSIHKPIWGNIGAAMKAMVDGGANIHVIPPQLLPGIMQGTPPNALDLRPMMTEIRSAKRLNQDIEFLVFARADRWVPEDNDDGSNLTSTGFVDWVRSVGSMLEAEGIGYDQWYLYPVDEPVADDIERLVALADALKVRVPGIRLYANPIVSRTNSMQRSQLQVLASRYDVLQPNLELALGNRELVAQGKWWYYENPPSPAKDASPEFYRSLGIRGWLLGAGGFGFWSFSDTSSSSAWDDFDGRRPDWSVVYESKNGVLGSRRWEAFKRGVADYRMLCSESSEHGRESGISQPRINADAITLGLYADQMTATRLHGEN